MAPRITTARPAATATTTQTGNPRTGGPVRNRDCPTEVTPEQAAQIREVLERLSGEANVRSTTAPTLQTGGTIKVYAHVIRAGTSPDAGNISDAMIGKQIEVLNKAFKGADEAHSWRFKLVKTDRTTNSRWYGAALHSGAEADMKRSLRRGGPDTLNLYFSQPSGSELGWSAFPHKYAEEPAMDGVVLKNTTLPGGSDPEFNQGKTGVHEVGHWLGLYHTFQNGCREPGDEVDDTPYEAEPGYGRPPATTDSCEQPGNDPVHNYMNYGEDEWLGPTPQHPERVGFTPGQVKRMAQSFTAFRAPRRSPPG